MEILDYLVSGGNDARQPTRIFRHMDVGLACAYYAQTPGDPEHFRMTLLRWAPDANDNDYIVDAEGSHGPYVGRVRLRFSVSGADRFIAHFLNTAITLHLIEQSQKATPVLPEVAGTEPVRQRRVRLR